ncbi:MAG: glycosyltransferase family 4 protein [Luteolibacter sp.]|uniref:glycosyltransferase family 4 protein n=1 Tax=Luteolibacter sp. TaxID=1962973 RepID=UPI0032631CF6
MSKPDVFLSAYACEPGKGSEPGVGWKWTNGLARRVNLQVLTRESNRQVIEQAVAATAEGDPLRSVVFHFHDLPEPFLKAKRRGWLPTLAYYAVWQWAVARRFGTQADSADVVHHLTFCTLLCPGFWKLKRAAFVLGPVGAPLVNPHYFPLFGRRIWLQRVRGWILNHFLHVPWLRRLLRSAAAVVPANSETLGLLASQGLLSEDVMLDTGTPDSRANPRHHSPQGKIRLLYAGRLERRKGLELALRALAKVSASSKCDWTFDILGSGPDELRLKEMTLQLNIAPRVAFHGTIPQEELMERFDDADAFLFTSVRDTSGGVNLEAMAHGLPVICIAHQGVGDITDDTCAARVNPGPIAETIDGLAAAVVRLAETPGLRQEMSLAASKRALDDFSWDDKFERMCVHYLNAIEKSADQKPS